MINTIFTIDNLAQFSAAVGVIVSVVTAYLTISITRYRLKVENQFRVQVSEILKRNEEAVLGLKRASAEHDIPKEIQCHIEVYEGIVNEAFMTLSSEDKKKVSPALNQPSQDGKLAYISKLVENSFDLLKAA